MIRLRLPHVSESLLGHLPPLPARLCPNVEDCLGSGTLLLEQAGIETARLDAECLLAHGLGFPRWRLVAERRRRLTPDEFGRYLTLLYRRELREPLAYLVGTREFWSLDLAVSPGVLVPRPETETLVEAALSLLRDQRPACGNGSSYPRPRRPLGAPGPGHPILIDLCTGSGAVAIALGRELPGATLFATDISRRALRIARSNAEAHGVVDRITFLRGNLWRALNGAGPGGQADLVVSNPPYIPSGIIPTLMPEIQWEPRRALDGGRDGLDFHRAIVAGAPQHIRPGGFLLLEIGADQAEAVRGLFEQAGGFEATRVYRDLAGRDRVVVARRLGNGKLKTDN
jgi:release factor glutamine methyltransferase